MPAPAGEASSGVDHGSEALSRWQVEGEEDAHRSLPTSPRISSRGLQHQGSSIVLTPPEPPQGEGEQLSELEALPEPPADQDPQPAALSPVPSSSSPSLTDDTPQPPASASDTEQADTPSDSTPVIIPEPLIVPYTGTQDQQQPDVGPSYSPMSHEYASQVASPEPFAMDDGAIHVNDLGMPASAAWPPDVDLDPNQDPQGYPDAPGKGMTPSIKPSSASSSRPSSSKALAVEEPLPQLHQPHYQSQYQPQQHQHQQGGSPERQVRQHLSMTVKNINPMGLEDPVVRPEQLPQLRNAPGLRRAMSMAPNSTGGKAPSSAVEFVPHAHSALTSGDAARSVSLSAMAAAASHPSAVSHRNPTTAPQLAGGSLVHLASVRDRNRTLIPPGPTSPRSLSPAVAHPSPNRTPAALTASSAAYTSRSNTGPAGTPGAPPPPQQLTRSPSFVPESYVPVGLEGRELHVPMHLVAQGQDHHVDGHLPFDDPQHEGYSAFKGELPVQGGWKGQGSAMPHKLLGGMAMPFAERKPGSGPPGRPYGKNPAGTVIKTVGRTGKASREAAASVPDARHVADQAPQGRAGAAAAPPQLGPDVLSQLISVKGVSARDHDTEWHNHLPSKPRKKGPGRINFKALRPLPSAISAGAGGLEVGKIKEGLARRMMAAEQNIYGPPVFRRKFDPSPPTPEAVMMDGFILLEAGDDELPEGIVAAKLSGKHIGSVESADLAYFVGLRVLDLSDNRLPSMAVLTPLVALQALSLSLNHLSHLGDWDSQIMFQDLVTLDLSYNQLDVEGVLGEDAPLALLPALRELNLSGNALTHLPDTLGPLTALELLKLADNRLTGTALLPLATLPALTSLNMAKNPTMHGLVVDMELLGAPGPDGYEASDILSASSLSPATSFPSLRLLDLSTCAITDSFLTEPLRALPCLARLLLGGNPLATAAVQVARREEQRRAKAAMLAADGAILAPGALRAPVEDPLLVWQPAPAQGPKPTVASVLAGGGGRFLAVREPLGRREAERAAALAAVAAVPEEAVGAAFERVDAAIEAWQLNTVPEGEEEEDEEEEGPPEEDMTFLTGGPPAPSAPERPQWEDVEDPTERLALALGLDPRRLAVYTGRPTQDALGSVNSLRFALSHPLVEADEGLGAAPNHLNLTEAARAKRRDRAVRLAPLDSLGGGATQGGGIPMPPDARTLKIQTVEDMLSAMRSRLATLEGTLTARLAAVPAAHQATAAAGASAPAGAGKSGRGSPQQPGRAETPQSDMEEEMDAMMPGSPDAARATSPFQPRVLQAGLEDEYSDLPDDVMEQIENSNPSSDAEVFAEDEDEQDNSPLQQQGANAAVASVGGGGPMTLTEARGARANGGPQSARANLVGRTSQAGRTAASARGAGSRRQPDPSSGSLSSPKSPGKTRRMPSSRSQNMAQTQQAAQALGYA